MKKKKFQWIRYVIQLIFFICMPSAFTAAFSGAKYVFTQMGNLESIENTSFLVACIFLCAYTILFGRFFCGFACAFGSLGDLIRAIYVKLCKKMKKKPFAFSEKQSGILSYIKYILLCGILCLCFVGVYGNFRGTSPWDVFSMLQAGNFRFQGYLIGVVLFIAILIGMALEERFFCKFLCPMGAIFSLLPVLPFFSLKRDREECIKNCTACTRVCPSNVHLPDAQSVEVCGECFMCLKCISTCPKGNIHSGIRTIRGNEILWIIIRALLLLVGCMWIGI